MAATMWRMNGLWRGVALALVLFTLLLNNAASQDATDAPVPTIIDADPDNTDATTASPDVDAADDDTVATVPDAGDSAATAAPVDELSVVNLTMLPIADSQGGADTSGTSGTPDDLIITAIDITDAPAAVPTAPETRAPVRLVVPDVKCVDKETINKNAVTAVVSTFDCEATKRLIQDNPAAWCPLDNCRLDLFQEGNTVLVASPDAKMSTLVGALQSESIKKTLGVSDIKTPPSSGSSVFVAVLLTGLLVAAMLIGGYYLKTRPCSCSDAKGMRLAEEAYPVDEQNQGNTLVSVAPLNPPAETQEKPIVNGETPEADKTPPPPTNGHSTTKTADTEL